MLRILALPHLIKARLIHLVSPSQRLNEPLLLDHPPGILGKARGVTLGPLPSACQVSH